MSNYRCHICGQVHSGAPLSWGPDAPDAWIAIPSEDRDRRGELGTDQAIMDDQRYFIRGRIEIPVVDTKEVFAWLVWVELNAADFEQTSKLWDTKGRERMAPVHPGKLANRLFLYKAGTLGLQVHVHTRPVGQRPYLEIASAHELRDEQTDGILSSRVQEIADTILHG